MDTPADQSPVVHDAFISYSRNDKPFAAILEIALESYKPPRDLDVPHRRLEIFRDEQDLTGTDYIGAIRRHLKGSRKLIIICSPAARASRFVDQEIRIFAEANGTENIIPVLLAGIPNNEMRPGQEADRAFPDALCEMMTMPLATIYRGFSPRKHRASRGLFEGSWFTILANIYGISRSELEQREKRRRLRVRRLVATAIGLLVAVLTGLSGWAVVSRHEAVRQRGLAEAGRQLAERAAVAEKRAKDEAVQAARAEREAREAERRQRTEAERNFQLAKQTVDEGFSGVEFDLKNLPGAEEYRLKLLNKARSYYLELANRRQGAALDLDHAKTILNLALIELELGRDAGPRFAEAVRFLHQAAEQHPNDLELQRHLFLSQLNVGVSFLARNQPAKAESALRAALAFGARLGRIHPDDLRLEMDRRLAENNLGIALLRQDRVEEGVRLIAGAKAGFQALSEHVGPSTGAREAVPRDQVDSHIAGASFNLAGIGGSGLPLSQRIDHNRAAWRSFEEVFRRDPTSPERAFRVAQVSRLMAALLLESGDAGEAEIYAERSFLILRGLARSFASNANYGREAEADRRFLTTFSPTWKHDLWFHEGALKILERLSEQGLPTPDGGRGLKHRRSIAHLSIAVNMLKPVLLGREPTISQSDSFRARDEFGRAHALNDELLRTEDRGPKREIYIVMKLNYPMWLELCP